MQKHVQPAIVETGIAALTAGPLLSAIAVHTFSFDNVLMHRSLPAQRAALQRVDNFGSGPKVNNYY